jgi:hypothetical protein
MDEPKENLWHAHEILIWFWSTAYKITENQIKQIILLQKLLESVY